MKKLKKLFSTLIVLALMAMVIAPTASARLVITPNVNGSQRSTTASWAGSNWTQVRASMTVTMVSIVVVPGAVNPPHTHTTFSSWQPFTARTAWVHVPPSNLIVKTSVSHGGSFS